jgi:hypothetical protein
MIIERERGRKEREEVPKKDVPAGNPAIAPLRRVIVRHGQSWAATSVVVRTKGLQGACPHLPFSHFTPPPRYCHGRGMRPTASAADKREDNYDDDYDDDDRDSSWQQKYSQSQLGRCALPARAMLLIDKRAHGKQKQPTEEGGTSRAQPLVLCVTVCAHKSAPAPDDVNAMTTTTITTITTIMTASTVSCCFCCCYCRRGRSGVADAAA